MSREELVSAYLKHLQWNAFEISEDISKEEAQKILAGVEEKSKSDPYAEAAGDLNDLVADQPEAAWQVMLEVTGRTESENQLGILGAGPLESFVHLHITSFEERITSEIAANPRFATAFRSVYQFGLPEGTWRRLNQSLRQAGVPENELIEWFEDENESHGDA